MSHEIKVAVAALIVGLSVGALLTVGFMPRHAELKAAKAEVKAVTSVLAGEHKTGDAVQAIAVKGANGAAQIRVQTNEVIRLVPQFVTPDVVAGYPLGDGFVRVVNASITGDADALAAAPAGPADTASAVAADDAAQTLVEDFGGCREAYRRDGEWRAYVGALGLIPKGDAP